MAQESTVRCQTAVAPYSRAPSYGRTAPAAPRDWYANSATRRGSSRCHGSAPRAMGGVAIILMPDLCTNLYSSVVILSILVNSTIH